MAGSTTTKSLYLQVGGDITPLKALAKAGSTALLGMGNDATTAQKQIQDALANTGPTPGSLREIEAGFKTHFDNIRRTAQSALATNDNVSALKLIDADGAQQQAVAARKLAGELRLAADATAALANREGALSDATRITLASFETQVVAAEQNAAVLEKQAGVMAGIAAEARLLGAAEDRVTDAHGKMGASGAILQHVVRSTTDSFAAGLPPMMIFTEQLGRLSEAAALSGAEGGAMGKIATFLSGGWGIAFTAAISIAGTLAGKLLEGGEAAKVDADAHNALKEAVDRLNSSQESLNHVTRQGIIDDIAAAEATRRREVQVRKLIDAELDAAKAKLSAANQTMANPGGSVPGAMFSAGGQQAADAQEQIATLTATQALNEKKRQDAEKAIRIGRGKLIDLDVEDATDPKSKVKHTYENEEDRLKRLHDAGKISDDQYRAGLTKATNTRDAADDALKPGPKAKKPKVDHSAEHAADADRAYQSQLNTAQDRLAKAQLALSDTAENRYAVEVQELDAAKAQRDLEIDDQVKAKKINGAQAEKLKKLNADATDLEKQADLRKEQQAILDRQLAASKAELDAKLALLQLQASFATSSKERLRLALQILATEEKVARDEATRKTKSADPEVQAQGKRDLAQIDAEHPLKEQGVRDANANPLQAYKQQLHANVGDMNDALKSVEVDGLKSIEDGFAGIISGTETVASAFKKMASAIISDLIRIGVEKAVLSVLGFSTGGVVGAVTPEAHADGGFITGAGSGTSDSILSWLSNGEFVMNAAATRRHLPLLHAMNDNTLPGFATGGLVGMPSVPSSYPSLPRSQDMRSVQQVAVKTTVEVEPNAMFDIRSRTIAQQEVGAAATPIMAGATTQTMKKLRRGSLPGGYA